MPNRVVAVAATPYFHPTSDDVPDLDAPVSKKRKANGAHYSRKDDDIKTPDMVIKVFICIGGRVKMDVLW